MTSDKNIDRLRKELIKSLDQPEIDFGKVLDLSSKIASLDPYNVRFSVDAALISRLGTELVARQETAVSELVKNAYDADATWVKLSFENADKPGGVLRLDDDGSGMNRSLLINGFMRLSSREKIEHPISPLFKRSRAGQKGIGRFAAQRLGSKLTVITQTEKSKKAFKVQIDWSRFKGDADLLNIPSHIEEIEKTRGQGTTLIIENLADSWPNESITRVYRYIADLIQPFPLSKRLKISKIDPGFDVQIFKIKDGETSVIASVEKIIYEYALAEIEGFVDSKGLGGWSVKSKQLNINEEALEIGRERDDSQKRYKYLKNINLKAYYYIYNAGYIPPIQNRMILDMAYERGGIRVYRNGFRVLPYGEPLNDWLSVDASSGRRLILPPHANINFFGFVEIIDPEGKLFQETSSREGLVENEAYKELEDFASRVLKSAVLRIAEVRERKKTAGQKKWKKKKKSPTVRLKETTQNLAQLAEDLEQESTKPQGNYTPQAAKQMAQSIKAFVHELEDAATEQEEEITSNIHELGMLRVLASLGLIIGEFTHELRHRFPPIIADANYFIKLHKTGGHNKVAQSLINHLNTFRTYIAYFDRTVSENARRELALQELGVVLRSFQKAIKPAAERYGILIHEPKIYGYDIFTPPMHPSEWVSILFNLFTNSHKAIKKAGVKGEIFMRAGKIDKNVYVDFSDNGTGIAPEIEPRIFDAFFTTTSPADPLAGEQEENIGMGLGLKIVKDIVTSYNGEIRLVPPPKGYRTCFKIELPRATDEEIKKHGY